MDQSTGVGAWAFPFLPNLQTGRLYTAPWLYRERCTCPSRRTCRRGCIFQQAPAGRQSFSRHPWRTSVRRTRQACFAGAPTHTLTEDLPGGAFSRTEGSPVSGSHNKVVANALPPSLLCGSALARRVPVCCFLESITKSSSDSRSLAFAGSGGQHWTDLTAPVLLPNVDLQPGHVGTCEVTGLHCATRPECSRFYQIGSAAVGAGAEAAFSARSLRPGCRAIRCGWWVGNIR